MGERSYTHITSRHPPGVHISSPHAWNPCFELQQHNFSPRRKIRRSNSADLVPLAEPIFACSIDPMQRLRAHREDPMVACPEVKIKHDALEFRVILDALIPDSRLNGGPRLDDVIIPFKRERFPRRMVAQRFRHLLTELCEKRLKKRASVLPPRDQCLELCRHSNTPY